MNEKMYLFNPFNIKNINAFELEKMYAIVFDKILE